jgi:hypothetical protein
MANIEFLQASFEGDLSRMQRMLADGEAHITDIDPWGTDSKLIWL